jgi:hypothetical protein
MYGLRTDVSAETRELRTEMHGMRVDLSGQIRELRTTQRADYRWLLGIMLGGFAGLLGVMARGFHWL